MQQELIQAPGALITQALGELHTGVQELGQASFQIGLPGPQPLLQPFRPPRRARLLGQGGGHGLLGSMEAIAVFGTDQEHRQGKPLAEGLGVDAYAESLRLIAHVEQHQGWQTQLLHLQS